MLNLLQLHSSAVANNSDYGEYYWLDVGNVLSVNTLVRAFIRYARARTRLYNRYYGK